MKRIALCATAFLLFIACTIPLVNGRKIQPKHRSSVEKTSHAATPNVTIVLRGLMVFHPDPGRKYFEAGILPSPGHRFRVEVREKTSGVSTFWLPLPPVTDLVNDSWSLEFTSPVKRGISLYRGGAFDRKAGIGDPKDFRWAVDIEGSEFYNQQVAIKENQLGPILRMTSGEFYTKGKSRPVMRRQGDGTFQLFGSIAEEIAADFITGGDVVLRSAKSGREILRLPAKPGSTYEIVLENLPDSDEHMTSMAASSDHFQYYYQVIDKPKTEWFEFKIADRAATARLTDVNQFRVIAVKYEPAPDPATCGLLGLLRRLVGLK